VAGRGYQNIITTDLVDDPILTDNNIRYFKKISKEMYNFTLVRHDYSSTIIRCRVTCLELSPYAGCDQALATEIQKIEGSREWPPEARCKGKTHIRRADEEHISLERAQAKAGADARNVAPQERSPQS
jgi:broad specificity phosphatase PhoE